MEDEYAVLLNLSAAATLAWQDAQPVVESGLVRLLAGEDLLDGRNMVAATADSTLARTEGEREHHRLFGDSDASRH